MSNLFEEKEWSGEFFLPDEYDKRFPGSLKYSPENGVILDYTITGLEGRMKSKVLHGVLNSGEPCTLVGTFNTDYSGISSNSGLTTRKGKIRFTYLILGDFANESDGYNDTSFTLTNLQEFVFPQGRKDLIKYSDKPILSQATKFGKIELGNNATFGYLGKDITSQIHTFNQDALKKLKEAFDEIQNEYPESHFMLKKDIGYNISLYHDEGADIRSIMRVIDHVSNLFALLIYSPVHPNSITITKNLGDLELQKKLFIYPSIVLSKRTIEIAKTDRSHFSMPITQSNIPLDNILKNWLEINDKYSTITSSIQHETGFRDIHSVHGEIVLYSTQLESISYSQNKNKSEKYQYPIDQYGFNAVKDILNSIFIGINTNKIGENIGKLRNEIAHVGRPKELLKKLTLKDLVYIEQCLQLIVISFILFHIGINRELIEKYQEDFTKNIK